MGHIQELRMNRAKRAFKEELFPSDKNRCFYVDHAGNAMGFTIERADGGVLSYNGETGRYEPFDVLPEDGAVNMLPYDYKEGKIADLLSDDPVKNIQKYTCFYACYFCGDFHSVITESEYRALAASDELYKVDTMTYEPIFDGKIYPTLADSSAAQIKAFGFHFGDDRRKTPSLAELSITANGIDRHRPLVDILADAEKRKTGPGPNRFGNVDKAKLLSNHQLSSSR